ncbi:MAG: PaaI family thioesterase [Paracoccaceae bacterium]|nr:PaaI family thioesterase [Paracoccaceae bacterium]
MSRPSLDQIAEAFVLALPHAKDLGMRLVALNDGHAELAMPWDEDLVGDPSSGVIHGGAVSALIDTTCGAAVMSHPENGGDTATLNLRIDYMRPARPGETLLARATCFHVTQTVAFVRADAVDGDPEHPVATASAAFTFQRRITG